MRKMIPSKQEQYSDTNVCHVGSPDTLPGSPLYLQRYTHVIYTATLIITIFKL